MKVFISSVIHGYGHYRDGVAEIIKELGYVAIRSEDFPAQPNTPQQACLQAVREADVMVLLLGAKYGTIQLSGLSATQEEYEEAEHVGKPILVFIESNTDPDQKQKQFIDQFRSWHSGKILDYFLNLSDLKYKIKRSLYQLDQSISNSEFDSNSLVKRAESLIGGDITYREPLLLFSLVGGPKNQIIRPAVLNDFNFQQQIEQYAKKKNHSVLESNEKTNKSIRNKWLILQQVSATIQLSQDGEIVVKKNLIGNQDYRDGLPVIIKERVSEHILGILQFCANTLDKIDSAKSISRMIVSVRITGNQYTPWRTELEHKRNPNRINLGNLDEVMRPVSLTHFARLVLRRDLIDIRDDLVAVIEREVYHG